MRCVSMTILAQVLATAALAQTQSEKVVSLFDEVCVAPTSSEERMAAGQKRAAEENWKLIRSEAAPTPMMHNENGANTSFMKAWEINSPTGLRARLYISVLRQETPDFRYTVCLIEPEITFDTDDLNDAINRQFKSTLVPETPARFPKSEKSWFFATEKSRGNCGKQVYFPLNEVNDRGKPKPLVFTDFAYPSGSPISKSTLCPN